MLIKNNAFAIGARKMVISASLLMCLPSFNYAQTTSTQEGAKIAFFLPMLAAVFQETIRTSTTTLFSNLFNRLFNPLNCWANNTNGNQPSSQTPINCPQASSQGFANGGGAGNTGGMFVPPFNASAPTQQATSLMQFTPDQAREKLSQSPAFTLKLERLANEQAGSAVLSSIEFRKQDGTGDFSYAIRSGEIFAIKFQTTVPGRVRILNEAEGKTEQIGFYEVIPEIDNRMPRARGMRVNPPAGTEYLLIEFTPCVSTAMLSDPRVAAFSAHLSPCSNEVASKQYTAGKYTPPAGSKAISNLDSPDMTQPVLAAREVSPGQTLTMRIVVDHQP